MKKAFSSIVMALLLASSLFLSSSIRPVKAPTTIIVPDDYPTIQSAINAASDGDTVFVKNGTYHENVIIKNNVTLIGEDKQSTIIDGGGTGTVVDVDYWNTGHATVKGFTIRDGSLGISLYWTSNSYIADNIICNNKNGISLFASSNNTLRYNTIVNNTDNFDVEEPIVSNPLNFFIQDIDTSNTVDGKPIYYWVNQQNRSIPTDAGYVAIVNSTEITAKDLDLRNNGEGLLLAFTTNSTIENTNMSNNQRGLYLEFSSNVTACNNMMSNNRVGVRMWESNGNILSNNRISGTSYYDANNTLRYNDDGITLGFNYGACDNNTIIDNEMISCGAAIYESSAGNNEFGGNIIANNGLGIWFDQSNNNMVVHNDFIANGRQAFDYCVNIWDNGYPSGGNYWSDYNGTDVYSGPYQNVTGSDGIGDTPYVVGATSVDHYPLIKPYGDLHDIGFARCLFKTVVFQNMTDPISMTVVNYGVQNETFSFTFQLGTISQEQLMTLAGGNSAIINFVWNTSGVALGDYSMNFSLMPMANETYILDNFCNTTICVSMIGDLTGGTGNVWDFVPDGKCDGKDISLISKCFGSYYGCLPPLTYNLNCDLFNRHKIDGKDIATVARHFGEFDPEPFC